jgi:hypothetical protein
VHQIDPRLTSSYQNWQTCVNSVDELQLFVEIKNICRKICFIYIISLSSVEANATREKSWRCLKSWPRCLLAFSYPSPFWRTNPTQADRRTWKASKI